MDAALSGKTHHCVPQCILQRSAPGDEHAQADGAFGMQSLEVLEIPVKKGILVVPFDLAGNDPGAEALDVINLV